MAAAEARERLAGIEFHPHAEAVLAPAIAPGGRPSHAYLFHGPPGTGKRRIARAFAAELLAEGSDDADSTRERALRGSHPDLTWVVPSGASEMLVGDIDGPVVGGAARTPFECHRRVFVVEGAETMNDQAANRMLKTLEEPPEFAHLVLIAERLHDVLATIASRCQHVRFDPLPASRIARELGELEEDRRIACARLARGDGSLARTLASEEGEMLRRASEELVRGAVGGRTAERPWESLLAAARASAAAVGELAEERMRRELELLPSRERRRYEREWQEDRRRRERRARSGTLDLGLELSELWLRDMLCLAEGAPELLLAVDRRTELEQDRDGRRREALRRAVELVDDVRLSLQVNVSEELALEALAYRLEELLAT